MTSERTSDERCPYCQPPYAAFTDDHIFPQFLGGRKTIRVCKGCNSTFGHSFEGKASQQIKRLQVFISHFGLDLSLNPGLWPSSVTVEGVEYDLVSGPGGAQYRLSKPILRRDGDGRIIGGQARSRSEANKIAKGMIESGNAKTVEISEQVGATLDDVKLNVDLSFDDNLFRFATKLAAAVLVNSGYRELISNSEIPSYLRGGVGWRTSVAYCDVTSLHEIKPPLAHTAYVELGAVSYAIILIFGFKKIFVPLPMCLPAMAILASLDPITGEEQFREVQPIGPRSVPNSISESSAHSHLQGMLDTLTKDADLRGAKNKPELYVGRLDLGTPMPDWWTNSTLRYMFPKFPFE